MGLLSRRLQLLETASAAGRPLMTALTGLLLIQNVLPAASALTIAALVESLEGTASSETVETWWWLIVFAVLLAITHVIEAFARPLTQLAKARINGAHREEMASLASQTATLEALEEPKVRDLLRQAAAEPQNWTERTPGDGALAQLNLILRYAGAVSSCIVLALYVPWLVPVLAVSAWLGREVRRRQWIAINRLWASQVAHGRVAGYWRDVITTPSTAKEAQIFGFGPWAIDRIQNKLHEMFDPCWRLGLRVQRQQVVPFVLVALPLAVVYGSIATSVVDGQATVAAEAAVLTAGWSVYQVVIAISDAFDIEGATPTLTSAKELRNRFTSSNGNKIVTSPEPATTCAPTAPLVEMADIRFTYPGSDRPVLDGLDMRIAPGERLAIVGLNGAGKSTLIKVLAGLYEPTAGSISVNGTKLDSADIERWQRQIAVVFQDFIRYHLPARDNVTLGRPQSHVNEPALRAAAAESGFSSIVEGLADGWATPLARDRRGGVDLSGGEWQLAALARALYAVHTGARLLILDEPTAHLDVRTEAELFERLDDRPRDASVVLVSHRLSTVRRADRIVVLHNGTIIESGSHDELMAEQGSYARMFSLQSRRFSAGYDDRIDGGDPR